MTNTIRHPDGTVAIASSPEQAAKVQRIIDERHRFNVEYCTAKGWPTDPTKLTIAQIMEIREQDGWKNAGQA
jgi:hypothetical protein